jgi:hypothetical protein
MRTIHTVLTKLNNQSEAIRIMKDMKNPARKQKNLSAIFTLVQTRKGGYRVE